MNTYDDQGGSPPAWDSDDPNAPATPPAPGYAPGPPALPTSGMSITSLVLGILSITCCYPFGVTALILGIPAIILGMKSRTAVREGRAGGATNGLALGGLICGIVGTVMGVILLALIVLAIATGNVNQSGGSPFGP